MKRVEKEKEKKIQEDFDFQIQVMMFSLAFVFVVNDETISEILQNWKDQTFIVVDHVLELHDYYNSALKILVVVMIYVIYIEYQLSFNKVDTLDLIYENPIEQFSFSIVTVIDYQNNFNSNNLMIKQGSLQKSPLHLDQRH